MLDLSKVKGLADVVRIQAEAIGDLTAIEQEGRITTYRDLNLLTNQVAQRLRQEWVAPQDRIATLAKNVDAFYQIWWGALKARVCLAPVNFRLAAPEIAYILKDSKAKILFVGKDFFEIADKALELLEEKPLVVSLDGPRGEWPDFNAWRNKAEPIDPRMDMPGDDDAIQLYTSGTTGNPKGVQLTNKNYVAFLNQADKVTGFKYDDRDVVLNAMPLFHVAGTNVGLAGLAQGCKVLVLRDFVPNVVLDMIGKEKINHAFFVPAMIGFMLQMPNAQSVDLSSMKSIAYGASPISETVLRGAQALFKCNFVQFYGMTETAGAGTFLPPEAHDAAKGKLRSCGIAWPGVEVRVVDAQGKDVPITTGDQIHVGEIVMRSEIVMKGYYNKPEATADAIRDGWMHTGDAAYKDADGYFFIYDRVKDMIVTGGENVYPAEVENAMASHPDVADCACIGVPDEKWGEAVKGIVVLKQGATPNPDSIIAHCRDRIANYKVPKSIDFVETIPRNASGKILRRELREPYWRGRDRQVG